MSFQWRLNGTNIAGATTSTLVLTNVQPYHQGNYSVRLTNSAGVLDSSNAFLAVQIPPPLRELYFRPHRDGFQVAPDLRSHVVFAHHNLLRDAPFTRLDLVSCRNVLIYMDATLQKRVLPILHYALSPAGYPDSTDR